MREGCPRGNHLILATRSTPYLNAPSVCATASPILHWSSRSRPGFELPRGISLPRPGVLEGPRCRHDHRIASLPVYWFHRSLGVLAFRGRSGENGDQVAVVIVL